MNPVCFDGRQPAAQHGERLEHEDLCREIQTEDRNRQPAAIQEPEKQCQAARCDENVPVHPYIFRARISRYCFSSSLCARMAALILRDAFRMRSEPSDPFRLGTALRAALNSATARFRSIHLMSNCCRRS